MKKLKVMSVFGTRPEAIKMAPVCQQLGVNEQIESLICLTGQQRDLLPPVLETFGIVADYDLNIMKDRQTLTAITTETLNGLEGILQKEKPDIVLCHGDTATAFSTALAAFYQKIPVGHVEAGLRTFDRYSPFPEEINRSLIGRIAQYHFCPTHRNRDNLTREKVGGEIFITGNTVIDAIHMTVLPGYKFHSAMFQRLLEPGKMIAVLTAHRRENLGVPLENICRAVLALSQRYPNLRVIYPVHPSPDVRDTVFPMLQGQAEIFLTPPIDTMDMHQLLARCHFVMTDSGGIQEEAPALGKPVLVLRKETERPEAIESGVALLAGVETDRIVDLASQIIDDTSLYERMAEAANPYGDGNAARRIVEYLLWTTKRSSEQPMPFEHIGYRG